ncbi:unnamed protein product [Meganyctiphanes norvegica]|uniref:Uncharacterized protein n=1 Tax=Meganyctiphanes norvegica TaxID=48144 RepID=A0AAV2SR74_MEGNR
MMTETEALEGLLEQPESSKKRHRSSRSSQAPKKKSRTGQTSSPAPPYKDDLVLRVHLKDLDDESVAPSSEDMAYIRKKGEEAILKELDFRPQIPPPIMCRGFIKFVCADKKHWSGLKTL